MSEIRKIVVLLRNVTKPTSTGTTQVEISFLDEDSEQLLQFDGEEELRVTLSGDPENLPQPPFVGIGAGHPLHRNYIAEFDVDAEINFTLFSESEGRTTYQITLGDEGIVIHRI